MMGQEANLDMIMAKGNKSRVSISVGGMEAMTATATDNNATTKQMGNAIPMKDEQKEELRFANGLFTEFDLMEAGAELKLAGVEQIDGKDAYGIEVTLPKGSKYTLYFDAETGLKTRFFKVLELPQGTFNQIVDYSDYKEVDGIMIYHAFSQQTGPQKMKATASEVLVNQDLPDDTFSVE